MKKKMAEYRGYVVTTSLLCYYGGLTSSLFALSVDGMSNNDVLIALVIVLCMGVPLPVLSTLVFFHLKRIRHKPEMQDEIAHLKIAYSAVIGGCREGREWYTVMSVYRRTFTACATALMASPELGYAQCWVMTVITLILFLCTLFFQPFEGGYRSADFKMEMVGHVLGLAGCFLSIGCFLTTGEPNETAGMVLVVLSLVSIFLTSLSMVPMVIEGCKALFEKWRNRNNAREFELIPQLTKHDSFVEAVPAYLRTKFRDSTSDL
eukprot:c11468_g1_i1.p1 GENE.c11468_g1_i1~~c11468_g1_i1.p1  ORF type:complete len:280 (-),score=57.98 c11468_g1_i1:29-817(-)